MKTTLLTLVGIFALASLSQAQNPKFGYTKPEIRPATVKAVSCPMSTQVRTSRPAPFAKGSGAIITTVVVKHDASCPIVQGRRCSAMG